MTADGTTSQALLVAHEALHQRLHDGVVDVLERLVATDVDGARAAFARFRALLDEHMRFEDEIVLPAYAQVAPKDGPGRADHVAGDHTILLRSADAIDELLPRLAGTSLRAVLVELPAIYRLLGTLEHHTAREQQHVYPRLDAGVAQAALEHVERAGR